MAETVADIVRSEGVVRVRLTGLDDGEVAEFVRLVTGAEADREVTEAIVGLTAGNAFLLTELWRELIQSQAIEVGATAVRLWVDGEVALHFNRIVAVRRPGPS